MPLQTVVSSDATPQDSRTYAAQFLKSDTSRSPVEQELDRVVLMEPKRSRRVIVPIVGRQRPAPQLAWNDD